MKPCPKCTAEMTGPVCDLCERFERVKRARIARWRFHAMPKPFRLPVPRGANGKPVAAQDVANLPKAWR